MDNKISVVFELNLKDVKKVIKSNAKGKMLSDKEVDNLIKKGVIRASDYLDKRQLGSKVSAALVAPDIVDKSTDRIVQKMEPVIVDHTYKRSSEKSTSPTQKKESGRVTKSRGKDFPKK